MNDTDFGIMLNIDINSTITPFLNGVSEHENVTEADLYPFVDVYRDSQITDVLICAFCQFSAVPSKVFSDFEYKYLQQTENGVPVDYKERFRGAYTFYSEFCIDPYEIWFRRLKEIGIRPWISVRMNDCHCPNDETSFLRSKFFYDAEHNGWTVGEKYGYFRHCFNYAVDEVRMKMLDYLKEQLYRYDIYGIELDFQREMVCFDYLNNPECHKIMSDFLGEIRKVTDEAGKIHGHKIAIAIRLARDIEQNKIYGFDVETIYSKRLCDAFVVSPRWATCDSDMPIDVWTRRFPDVPVVAGLELHVNRYYKTTPEIVRGYTAQFLSEGSHGIYLFNQFISPESADKQEIYHTCGNKNTVLGLPRRVIVTYQDTAPIGSTAWHPLPLSADGRELTVAFGVGAEHTAVIFGLDKIDDISRLKSVKVNGVSFTEFEPCASISDIADCQFFRIVVPNSITNDKTALTLSFDSVSPQDTVAITYIEISMI